MNATYYATVKTALDDGSYFENEVLCMDISAKDVQRAVKEFDRYMNCKGDTYAKDSHKVPTMREFFKLYFGEVVDYNMYYGETYLVPSRFVCTNKTVAQKLYELLGALQYHDTYNQVYCDVSIEKNIVYVVYGDY